MKAHVWLCECDIPQEDFLITPNAGISLARYTWSRKNGWTVSRRGDRGTLYLQPCCPLTIGICFNCSAATSNNPKIVKEHKPLMAPNHLLDTSCHKTLDCLSVLGREEGTRKRRAVL